MRVGDMPNGSVFESCDTLFCRSDEYRGGNIKCLALDDGILCCFSPDQAFDILFNINDLHKPLLAALNKVKNND